MTHYTYRTVTLSPPSTCERPRSILFLSFQFFPGAFNHKNQTRQRQMNMSTLAMHCNAICKSMCMSTRPMPPLQQMRMPTLATHNPCHPYHQAHGLQKWLLRPNRFADFATVPSSRLIDPVGSASPNCAPDRLAIIT